ncbi:MAG: glycosyltransferase, partial [Tissierellia bacterium]|nr:glycosyltransferase [Tissierellia bacterium]
YFKTGHKKKIDNQIRLCFIALNIEEKIKNYPMVYKVFQSLYKIDHRFEMVVIGNISEEYRDRYHHDRIIYKGPLEKKKVLEELQNAHIYFMPSLRETFGLVYVEAMSQGLPIIYTKGQGFDGQFPEGEIGYGVEPDQEQEMIDKIFEIIKNYSEMSRRAVENAKKFNWKDISREYIQLYDKIRREKR